MKSYLETIVKTTLRDEPANYRLESIRTQCKMMLDQMKGQPEGYANIDEQLYIEVGEQVSACLEMIFKDVMDRHNCPHGEISPADNETFDDTRMKLVRVMCDVIKDNLPKVVKGTITILNPSDSEYRHAVDSYEDFAETAEKEHGQKIKTYFRYDDDEQPLYFVQTSTGLFHLILGNQDWLTYDLKEILRHCNEYNAD